ncbi:MAG: SDR family NAD(P)-dependent oxidoreductase [Pseudomonadota bacterium]
MIDFTNKTIFITGAAAGIGEACALTFAKAGGDIVMADIDASKLQEAEKAIATETGAKVMSVVCDVADDAACRQALDAAEKKFGAVDILINNAGVIAKGSILDLDPDEFDRVLRVNLRSYFILTQMAAKRMVEAGVKGAIINMSSLNSVLAIPDQVAYVTSKGGLQQLTKAAALGLAEHGIRVNAIGPGSIMTDILKVVMHDEAARRKILSRTPLGRVGEPDEIAGVALFLASDLASYITGQTIFPDGGRSALNYTVPVND